MARARASRTWSAAADSRSTGRATNRCSSSEDSRVTREGDQDEGHQRPALGGDDLVDVAGLQRQHAQHRAARAGPARRPRPPARRSRSGARWRLGLAGRSAAAISRARARRASLSRPVGLRLASRTADRGPGRAWAGGSGVDLDRSATAVAVGDQQARRASNSRARWPARDEAVAQQPAGARSGPACGSGSPAVRRLGRQHVGEQLGLGGQALDAAPRSGRGASRSAPAPRRTGSAGRAGSARGSAAPSRDPPKPSAIGGAGSSPGRSGSAFAVSVSDAIQGLDRVELGVDLRGTSCASA